MKYHILLGGFLLMQAGVLHAKDQIKVSAVGTEVSREGDSVRVSFRLNATGLKKEYVLGITPVLCGKDGVREALPPVRYGSRTAQIQEWRDTGSLSGTFHRGGEEVAYTHALPYKEWMEGASLQLEAVNRGCCDERTLAPLTLAGDMALATPAELFVPEPVQPESAVPVANKLAEENSFLAEWSGSIGDQEDIARYREEATLVVYFPVGSSGILPDYEGNGARLDHLLSVLGKIAASKDSRVAKILVMGSASPDGTKVLNERIAGERGRSLVAYLAGRTELDASFFEVNNDGVSWSGLRKLVMESDMPEKRQIVEIIDTVPVWDVSKNMGRLGMLMKLNHGKPYRYMKEHFFPKLRNAGYIKVFYESQPDPRLVSFNKAVDLLRQKKYAEAERALEGNTYYKADNLRGIIRMEGGHTDEAAALFRKGAEAGDAEAGKNLERALELLQRER